MLDRTSGFLAGVDDDVVTRCKVDLEAVLRRPVPDPTDTAGTQTLENC
jgi:hypothetical protein